MTLPAQRRIAAEVERAERAGFSGVVRVDVGDSVVHASGHGQANRAHSIPNTVDTRLAAASALKACTALVMMRLVERGDVQLGTAVRSICPECASFVDPPVTVCDLLAHRSGIGEYCDEIDPSNARPRDPTLACHPPCAISAPSAILTLMSGVPHRSTPGAEFRYNNAGYVLLALLAETVSGLSFADLVTSLVFGPAGMVSSAILRYDELAGDVAIGYLERSGLRTNVHAVPNRGVGDGGLFTTAADMVRFWRALHEGRLVGPDVVAMMTTEQGRTKRGTPYGLGFWLDPTTDAVAVEGYDWGISFRSVHRPSTGVTWTVASNWTDGAWPLAERLAVLCPDAFR